MPSFVFSRPSAALQPLFSTSPIKSRVLSAPPLAPGRKLLHREESRQLTVKAESGSSHAALHDFCMGIPFGGAMTVAGLVSSFLCKASSGLPITAMGAAIVVSSILSLKAWKKGASSMPFTVLSTGLAAGIASLTWPTYKSATSKIFPLGILVVCGAMLAFLVYNLVAGGNPPSKKV
ncbi:hypothetical protein BSKO_12017 [Bryopsis sp. KO-2023]|nr:hypothetical protein BSKO_12017 [Bryopsis sp. KO-2023]